MEEDTPENYERGTSCSNSRGNFKYFEKFKITFYVTNAPPRAFIYFSENPVC